MKENLRNEVGWLLAEKYGGKKTREAERDIARLQKGEHVDYVIGWVDFLGCKIDLSQKPLIPRPETEYWIGKFVQNILGEAALASSPNPRPYPNSARAASPRNITSPLRRLRVLDIFAGSGCVGIAVLKHVPWATVDFAEKDKELLKQIRLNAKRNGIELKRYRVLRSDIFSGVKGKYDYILANPPYVAEARRAHVQKSVLEQEPVISVFGGKDGLLCIRPFSQQAKRYLKKGGTVWMEFDSPQKSAIEKLLKERGYAHRSFGKDQYGKWRYVSAASLKKDCV